MIEKRTEKILEYDKIRNTLSSLALTAFGRERCEALEPSTDIEEVKEFLQQTDDGVKLIFEKSAPPLDSFFDIRISIARASSRALLSCKELLEIGHFLRATSRLISFIPKDSEKLKVNFISSNIMQLIPLENLEKWITKAIASEDDLYDNASPALSTIRKKIRDAQSEVKKSLENIVRSHASDLQEQLVTMRGSRYVVMVKADHRSSIPGIIHDTSSSKATLFVEPYQVVELNNRIREYMSSERDEIERILRELSLKVSENTDVFKSNMEIVEIVDFTMAKAALAIKMNAMPPHINRNGRIRLLDARHPLIPKEQVVPITIELGINYKTLVITGPNTGGKTVSLKTCGLLTLMAMAGLQIPAREASEVSIFDNIFADIGDEQSIEQSLSTFSSHMRNLVNIIANASKSTLALVDELGAGTDPSSGAALAISILEYLKSKGCKTIATTHYKELKHYAITSEGVENACCEFDVETLMPTYRLHIGIPGVSNAFAISKRLGLQDIIIEKAKSIMDKEELDFESLMAKTEEARKNAFLLEQNARNEYAKAKAESDRIAKINEEIDASKKEILSKARISAREYVEEIYDETLELLSEVKKTIKDKDLELVKDELNEIKKRLREKTSEIDNAITLDTLNNYVGGDVPKKLKIGETYFSSTLNVSGMLVEINKGKSTCALLVGNKRITVPVSSLRDFDKSRIVTTTQKGRYQAAGRGSGREGFQQSDTGRFQTTHKGRFQNSNSGPQSRSDTGKGVTLSKREAFSTEIKLLGMTADEACEKLDKYLDDAVLSGIKTVRIVHGKGTGALRSAVNQMLKSDSRVKSFRLGEFGEGDSGVTIVTF